MPYETKQLGAAGHVLRYRLRFQQRAKGKSLAALARNMRDLGYPMTAARIGEAFNGYRRISTDELTALATSLGVSAGALVLDASPAADIAAVDRIAALEVEDLGRQLALAQFAIGPIEEELDHALSLSRQERAAAGLSDPADALKRLEAAAIEVELLDAEHERRVGKDWSDGEH